MGLGLGTALSIGGSLLGALGSGRNSQQALPASGFGTLPGYASKYAEDEIFPRIKKWGQTGYQGIPRRALVAEDLDPIFGSRARQALVAAYSPLPISGEGEAGSAEAGTEGAAATSDTKPEVSEEAKKMLESMTGSDGMAAVNMAMNDMVNRGVKGSAAQYAYRTGGDEDLMKELAKILAAQGTMRDGAMRQTEDTKDSFEKLTSAYRRMM